VIDFYFAYEKVLKDKWIQNGALHKNFQVNQIHWYFRNFWFFIIFLNYKSPMYLNHHKHWKSKSNNKACFDAINDIKYIVNNFSAKIGWNLVCFETKWMNWGLPDVFILIGQIKSCHVWADVGIFERSGTNFLSIIFKTDQISPHLALQIDCK